MQVAVDASELLAGFEHAGGGPAQGHLTVTPVLHVLGVFPADLDHGPDLAQHWTMTRAPFLLETSLPGVFAVGDVRHGSVKGWRPRSARAPSASA